MDKERWNPDNNTGMQDNEDREIDKERRKQEDDTV